MTADVPLSVEEKAAIRARADAATPGPWNLRPYQAKGKDGHLIGDDAAAAVVFMPKAFGVVHVLNPDAYNATPKDGSPPEHFIDAEFIAHARTDVPRLLNENDRLRRLTGICDPCLEERHADCHADCWCPERHL